MTEISTVASVAAPAIAPQAAPHQAPDTRPAPAPEAAVPTQTDEAVLAAGESAAVERSRGRVLDIEV